MRVTLTRRRKMTIKKCRVKGCENFEWHNGLCIKHSRGFHKINNLDSAKAENTHKEKKG